MRNSSDGRAEHASRAVYCFRSGKSGAGEDIGENGGDAEDAGDKSHALRALIQHCVCRALTGAVTERIACFARW